MTFLSRYLPALSLSLVLLIASAASGFAMAPARSADGSIVICNGSGLVTIRTGEGPAGRSVTLLCPECLPAHLATDPGPFEPVVFAAGFRPVAAPVPAAPRQATPAHRPAQPRAPPFV